MEIINYWDTPGWKQQVKENMALISERKERVKCELKPEKDEAINDQNEYIMDMVRSYTSDDYVDWLKRLGQ